MSNASAFCILTINVEIKFLQNKDQERYFIRSVAVFDGFEANKTLLCITEDFGFVCRNKS